MESKIQKTNNFISSMIEESKYCSKVTKKHFHKELVMNKDDNKDFKNSTKCWICEIKSQNSCCILQPKKLWFSFYYTRTRQIQF